MKLMVPTVYALQSVETLVLPYVALFELVEKLTIPNQSRRRHHHGSFHPAENEAHRTPLAWPVKERKTE
jgi:hypothetical protein